MVTNKQQNHLPPQGGTVFKCPQTGNAIVSYLSKGDLRKATFILEDDVTPLYPAT